MNKLIAFAIRVSGGGWLWKAIDGKKTILGATGKVLAGAASVLAGASNIIIAVVACEGMPCVVELARGIATNPDALMVMAGWYGISSGLEGIGFWDKDRKRTIGPTGAVQAAKDIR